MPVDLANTVAAATPAADEPAALQASANPFSLDTELQEERPLGAQRENVIHGNSSLTTDDLRN